MIFGYKTVYVLKYTHCSLETTIEGVYDTRELAQKRIDYCVNLGGNRDRYRIIEKELIGEYYGY